MSEHEGLREQLAATERRLAAARARRDAAEAKVARVEAALTSWGLADSRYRTIRAINADLRAALSAPQPADVPEGHGGADGAGEGL